MPQGKPVPPPTCGTCLYFVAEQCHRFPPTVVPRAGSYVVHQPEHRALVSAWPDVVGSTPPCGEFKKA